MSSLQTPSKLPAAIRDWPLELRARRSDLLEAIQDLLGLLWDLGLESAAEAYRESLEFGFVDRHIEKHHDKF